MLFRSCEHMARIFNPGLGWVGVDDDISADSFIRRQRKGRAISPLMPWGNEVNRRWSIATITIAPMTVMQLMWKINLRVSLNYFLQTSLSDYFSIILHYEFSYFKPCWWVIFILFLCQKIGIVLVTNVQWNIVCKKSCRASTLCLIETSLKLTSPESLKI
jgi:hypothetical protein